MTLAHRAGLLASAAAVVCALVTGALMHWVLGMSVTTVPLILGLVLLATLAAYGSYFLAVRRRFGRKRPVLGAYRGAALAVAVFALVVLVHSIFSPGADGFPISFIGQFVFAFLIVGWASALVGAVLGILVDKQAAMEAPNSTVERDGPQAARPSL